MYCTKCGTQLPENACYCTSCGHKVLGKESEAQPEYAESSKTAKIVIAGVCIFILFAVFWFLFGRYTILYMSMKFGKIAEQCKLGDYEIVAEPSVVDCTRNYATVRFIAISADSEFCRWETSVDMYYEYEPFKGWIYQDNDRITWEELKAEAFVGSWELTYPKGYMYGSGRISLEIDKIDFDTLTVECKIDGNWDDPLIGPSDYEISENGSFFLERDGWEQELYYRMEAGREYIIFADKGIMFGPYYSDLSAWWFQRQ